MKRRLQSIRRKLLHLVLTATVPLVLVITIAVIVSGLHIWRNSLSAMETRIVSLQQAIDTVLRETIVTYLHAKTETALSSIELIDRMYSENQKMASELINRHLLSMQVARSGYIYVLDSRGHVVLHPDPATVDRVIPEIEPVRTQLQLKSGYLEYSWQNSFEPLPLPKALYMDEFTPRGWIVAATAYREEFVELVDRGRLADLVDTFTVGPGSYSVVVSRDGNFVVHPEFSGRNLSEFFDVNETERVMSTLFSQPEGTLYYSWPNSTSDRRSRKLLVFRYLPDFDWTIATTIDVATIGRPVLVLSLSAFSIALLLVTAVVFLSLRMSRSVSVPVVTLAEATENGRRAPVTPIENKSPRELVVLTEQFNSFIDRIEEQQTVLQKGIHEKTVLVHEIHHRVKNNLQVIASLLNLQSGDVAHPDDAVLFHNSRDRVLSIAMVHEQLYQTDDLSMIPFDLYLQDLIGHIRNTNYAETIKLNMDISPVSLSIDSAVPCGLIINELVSNAFKHAFVDTAEGSITVRFGISGDGYLLEVSDTGCGMEESVQHSLGMTLVHTLVEQLGGTVEVSGLRGTVIRITFPGDTQESYHGPEAGTLLV